MWSNLNKAKKISMEIENEIDLLIKKHNGLMKREIALHSDILLGEINESIEKISSLYLELENELSSHKLDLKNKSLFLKRHNSRKSI